MERKNPVSVFKGKQGQMYAVALLAWAHYERCQKDFAKKNSKYTLELAAQQVAAIQAAQQVPDAQQRRDVPKEARILLSDAAIALRNIWQDLSALIESTFDVNLWAVKKSAAGGNFYEASGTEDWVATFNLGKAASAFITDNTDALEAGGMLPAFPDEFAGVKTVFDDLYNTFFQTKEEAIGQTGEKTVSSNDVFKAMMSMINVGKNIYRNDPVARRMFIYSSLMKSVRGQGFTKTGYHFICKDAATGLPVTSAQVVFTAVVGGTPYSGKMGKNGNLRCDMPAGNYEYVLKSPGYTTLIGTVKAIEGSARQKTLHLVADTGSTILPQSKAV